jgi:hypothetical protein
MVSGQPCIGDCDSQCIDDHHQCRNDSPCFGDNNSPCAAAVLTTIDYADNDNPCVCDDDSPCIGDIIIIMLPIKHW